MKKLIFLFAALSLYGCSSDDAKDQFCGNVTWSEYDISTNSSNVTLDNGIQTKVINVKPAKQYSKGEYICL